MISIKLALAMIPAGDILIEKRADMFKDRDTLRVILYLREYNPEVKISHLEEKLEIPENHLVKILSDLIENDIAYYDENEKTYELTPLGRNVIEVLAGM